MRSAAPSAICAAVIGVAYRQKEACMDGDIPGSIHMKEQANLTYFHVLLWAAPGQNPGLSVAVIPNEGVSNWFYWQKIKKR